MNIWTEANLDPQWFALRVMPQWEHFVGYQLRKQGNATFIPTEIRTHKRSSYSKGKAEFAVPIIPGLVFAGFPGEPAWYDVQQNHLILGPLGMDGKPWRLDFVKLIQFFAGVNDGCMVLDGGLRLIHIPGRGPVRALNTRARTISPRKRKKAPAPVQEAAGRYADILSRFVHGGTG